LRRVRQEEGVRGVEITILKDTAETDPDIDTFCYGFKENWLIAGSSLKFIRQVLITMDGDGMNNLEESEVFARARQRMGQNDIMVYCNAQAMIEAIMASAKETEKEKTRQTIKILGLDNVTSLAGAIALVPAQNKNVHLKLELAVDGPKRGVPKLITPETASWKPHRSLIKGLAGFMVANYDLPSIYDGIMDMAWRISNINVGLMAQGAMMQTSKEGTVPPVDLRKELIGSFTKPLIVTSRIDKPYADPDSVRSLLSIGVLNPEMLDTAWGRVHDTFIAQGNKELRRELNNHTIYLLPGIPFIPVMPGMAGGNSEENMQLGFAVAGDDFVFGKVQTVEQAIRDLGRAEVEGIQSDSVFQYADDFLPAEAGMFNYQNHQIEAEMYWEVLPKMQQETKTASKNGDDDSTEIALEMNSADPMAMLLKNWEKYFDFDTLPSFEQVKHYFGVTVGHMRDTDNGRATEIVWLKSPKEN